MIRIVSLAILTAALSAALSCQGPTKDDKVTAGDPAIKAIDKFLKGDGKPDTTKSDWRQRMKKPPTVTFAPGYDYYWNIQTNKGDIKVRLLPDVAPQHVASTIVLSRAGFYDALIFHRVIPGFMAQGGCPLGRGSAGPGYEYAGEFSDKVKHDRPGLLSMANRGPGTDGSQFFLTFVPTAWLDGKHTIFGEVVGGLPVLKELEKAGSRSGQTKEKLTMEQTWITVAPQKKAEEGKGDEKPAPKKTEPKKTSAPLKKQE